MLVILVNLVAPVNSTIKQFRMICLSVNGVDGKGSVCWKKLDKQEAGLSKSEGSKPIE